MCVAFQFFRNDRSYSVFSYNDIVLLRSLLDTVSISRAMGQCQYVAACGQRHSSIYMDNVSITAVKSYPQYWLALFILGSILRVCLFCRRNALQKLAQLLVHIRRSFRSLRQIGHLYWESLY